MAKALGLLAQFFMKYNDFATLLLDITNYVKETGNHIMDDSNPKTLTLGFKCRNTNNRLDINIIPLRKAALSNELKLCLGYLEGGRQVFISAVNSKNFDRFIKKYMNLKTFW